jgi:hypothetical protein
VFVLLGEYFLEEANLAVACLRPHFSGKVVELFVHDLSGKS